MIKASCATRLGIKVTTSSRSAHQADGSSLLHVIGDTRTSFSRDGYALYFEGLVVENLDIDILAGVPFIKNHISIRPSKQVMIKDTFVYQYGLCDIFME